MALEGFPLSPHRQRCSRCSLDDDDGNRSASLPSSSTLKSDRCTAWIPEIYPTKSPLYFPPLTDDAFIPHTGFYEAGGRVCGSSYEEGRQDQVSEVMRGDADKRSDLLKLKIPTFMLRHKCRALIVLFSADAVIVHSPKALTRCKLTYHCDR